MASRGVRSPDQGGAEPTSAVDYTASGRVQSPSMIHGVTVSLAPLSPGQARDIAADSDGDVEITIFCVRSVPPPMQLVPCGTVVLCPRVTGQVFADLVHFPPGSQGELQLTLKDILDRDEWAVSIPVGITPGLSGAGSSYSKRGRRLLGGMME